MGFAGRSAMNLEGIQICTAALLLLQTTLELISACYSGTKTASQLSAVMVRWPVGYWAVSKGLVKAPENGPMGIVVDVPSGRVVATVTVKDGKSIHADFVNVSTYSIAKGLPVTTPSRDADVSVDLAFGGAVVASVNAAQLGLEVKPSNANEFIRLQREIKASLGDREKYGSNELYAMLFFEAGEDMLD